MKRGVFQLALIVLLHSSGKTIAQGTVFLSEGFESCNETTKPAGWSEVRVSGLYYWKYKNGGGAASGTPDFRHPSAAHTGTKNALFQVEGTGPTSRLITPAMDLRYSIKPVLSLWLAQDVWDSNTDELRVYYRTSTASAWIPLETYLATLLEWSKREIVLPAEVKVQTCQLAFEAKSNYGWGVCVDDVLVDERGTVPRSVSSINTSQINDYIASGTTVNPIAFIEITIAGNTNNLYITAADLTYSGTTISDISNFKLYYTRDSIFANSSLVPLTATINSNTIQFSGGQQLLATGLNYIWVCADVSAGAVHGNIVDISVPVNSLTIGGSQYPSIAQNPSGNCTVEQSIAAYDFETAGGWTLNNSWAIGIPLGGGLNDPTSAYAGQKVMATNLNGNYPPNITEGNEHRATMNAVNAKYFQKINVRYKRWLNVESSDKARVWLSTDGGTNWVMLMENTSTLLDRYWKSISHDIGTLATRKESVIVRFAIDESDVSTEYGGWNVDNFAITGDFIAKDLGVSGITSPASHCGMTGAETVIVKIKNYGGAAVSDPFDVGFSLDNGVTYTRENINPTIAVDGEYAYTFTATANLSQPGLKYLKFKTFLTGDEDLTNDAYSTTLFVFPSYNYSYTNSFETTNGYWHPSGTNSTWAWGIVAKTIINKASDGTKVWVTGGLKSNYANSEQSYLESPCFDFSTSEYPVFSFDYLINSENGVDGFRLDYSIDGGTTWDSIPKNLNHNINWCIKAISALGSVGWTGSTATLYQTAKTLLPASVIGENNVKFRFVFASNSDTNLEGVAIDNIKIYELPYDVGFKRLVTPISGCYIGNNVPLVAKVTNHGYRPLKAGLKVPIEVKLRNENIIKDTLVIGSLVPSLDSTTFTSTGTYNIFTKGSHALRLNTNFTPELNRTNDTLKTTLQVKGIPSYSIGGDKAVTTAERDAGVVLDGGQNGLVDYNSYSWSSIPPLDPLTPPTTNKTFTAYIFGSYTVTVTNENSCTAKDTIKIIESNSDIQILSVTGLDNACEYPTPVYPQITIKNNGPNTIGPISLITKTIPLSIMVDSVVKVSEVFTIPSDVPMGSSASFTFTNSINISNPNKYDIRIYSKISEDPIKSNDTLKVATEVWGFPDVNLPYDTVATYQADSLILNARYGFDTYKWQDNSVDSIFNVTSLNSAWYKVTVTDFHGCGNDKDSLYVNAKDLSLTSIENPTPSFCDNEYPKVSIIVNNSGRDDFLNGEKINISYTTPDESISQEFTLTAPLPAGSQKTFTFSNSVKLPSGEGFINVVAQIANDLNSSNNTLERSFEKRLSPTVSFNPSTLSKVFGGTPYTISPVYSGGIKSYSWRAPILTGIGSDSLYTIYDTPPGRNLFVIAYEELGQIGCNDTAMLTIVADDIAVDAIKTPTNKCELGNSTPVTITVANKGNFTYPSGTSISIDLSVDGVHAFNEPFELSADFLPNGKLDIPLSQTVDLAGKSSSTIQVTISTTLDVVASNNTLNKTVYSTGYPSVNLGTNKTVHSWNDTLRAGSNYDLYTWTYNGSSAGTDSTLCATQSGTYKVTVTDFNGCTGTSNEVVLTFVVDDINLKTLDNPKTGCGLSTTEPVKVTVENSGTEIVPNSTVIEIGFTQDGVTKKENIILTSILIAGESRSFDLAGTMNFLLATSYPIKVWTKMAGDMRDNNDTLPTTVTNHSPVLYSQFIVDTIEIVKPDTLLDAGGGFTTYHWSTGETTQTKLVTTTGNYWVDVTNINGCSARDSVYVKFLHDVNVKSLVTPQTSCSLSTTETVKVRLVNGGLNKIPKSTAIQLKLKIGPTTLAVENCTLTDSLAISDSTDYTFTYKPNLSAVGNHLIEVFAHMPNDKVQSNDTLRQNIFVYGNPTPNLGADRIITIPAVLNPGSFSIYEWQDHSTNPTFTATQSGLYSVIVTDANSCTGYDEVNITWQETSDVRVSQLISPSTNCFNSLGQTVTAKLTNMGTRTFNSGENINVSYQVGTNTPVVETLNFTSSFANGQSINYTFSQKALINPSSVTMYLKTIIASVDGLTANFPVTINSNPSVTLTLNPVCINASAFALTGGSPTGGNYSGSGVISNSFDPSAAGVGTHPLTYNYTDGNGCTNSATTNITVSSLPTVTFTSLNPVCSNTTAFALTGGSPTGGNYSGTGVSSNNFGPSVAGVGTHTITYTYTLNGCTNSATSNIMVNSIPTVTFSNLSAVCLNTTAFVLSGGSPAGGNYSGTGVNSNNFNPSAAGAGTHTLTYTYTDGNGCSNSATSNITVNSLPAVTFNPLNPVCADAATFALTGGSPAGGNYSGTGVSSNSFEPSVAGVGTHTLTYTYTDGNGCTSSATSSITVNPLPNVSLGSDRTVTVATVLDPGTGYTSYLWQDNSTNQTFTVTQSGTYSVTVTNANGCKGSASVVITFSVGVETIPGTNAKVSLFPNPVNNELTITIETDKTETFTIDLINPNGQIVKSLKTDSTIYFKDKINVDSFSSGVYFIKVSNNKGSAVLKVVVER